jgi:poly(3-hydroxyalkanoate) synthetase
LLRRIVQAYLATGRTAEELVADAELGWRDHERTSFLVSNLIEAAAPSNNPVLSPVAWKAAIDSGGVSALRGLRNLANDLASAPRVPTMVAPDAYRVGVDLASHQGMSCCAPRCSSSSGTRRRPRPCPPRRCSWSRR